MNSQPLELPGTMMQPQVLRYANELMSLVRARHIDAQFHGPTYWPEESLWVIDAFFAQGEDFDLQEQLSARETDILLSDGVWLCVVPMPLSFYTPL